MPSKKDVATTILTLGLSWLWKRVVAKQVAKKLPAAVGEVVDAFALGRHDKVPAQVQEALDAIVQERARLQFEKGMAAVEAEANKLLAKAKEPMPPAIAKMQAMRAEAIRRGKAAARGKK